MSLPLLLLATLAAAGGHTGDIRVDTPDRTSQPKGPTRVDSWTRYEPLPRPASQAKRRRKARRVRGGR